MQTLKDQIEEKLHDALIDLRHAEMGIADHGPIEFIKIKIKTLKNLLEG